MPRSPLAYLSDIIGACDAIEVVLAGVDLETYKGSRPIRSSVEREFILVGEAVASLSRLEPEIATDFARPDDRRIPQPACA